ncbi:MAG: hypothetical protein JWM33_406 [Caulobacteraceae bacterium]|nr:hypothetical protein [Caulobacteraceae bacterium]
MNMAMILPPLAMAALAAGAALAAAAQPACHWSSLGAIALKTRLAMIRAIAPSRHRARLAALGLAGLLCAGALAAYAAEPSAPQRLAAQAAGVVGSGDQLSLRVVEDQQPRTLKPGDTYSDGWKLESLTPSSATLTRDGERREVGLNPTGALASAEPAAPASRVRVLPSDAELLAQATLQARWDGQTPLPGLTLAETTRYYLLRQRGLVLASNTPPPGPPRPPGSPMVPREITGAMVNAAMGPDTAEFAELGAKQGQANFELAVAAYERFGPIEVPIPVGQEADAALKAAYPGARWRALPGSPPTMVMAMPSPSPVLVSTGPAP